MDCHITDVQDLFFVKNNLKKAGSSYLSSFLLNVSKLIYMKKIGMKFPQHYRLVLIVHFFKFLDGKAFESIQLKSCLQSYYCIFSHFSFTVWQPFWW